jgi:predicted nucleotidyltransferase
MREVSRRARLAQASVINHLKALKKEGLVVKEKKGTYSTYRANRENSEFRLLKKQNLVWRISKCGLASFLEEKFKPNCIVLFGSGSRGEDTETSDIDIFVQAEEAELDLKKYEKALGRKIMMLFEPDLKALNKELLNNIINGQILYGYLKVL